MFSNIPILHPIKQYRLFTTALIFVILLSIACGCSNNVNTNTDTERATSKIILDNKQKNYPVGKHVEYMLDPTNELSIKDVISDEYDGKFIKSETDVPNFGQYYNTLWVKYKVKNLSDIEKWLIAYSNVYIYNLEMYISDAKGNFKSNPDWITGLKIPYNSRNIKHYKYLYELNIPKDSEKYIYMKFRGIGITLHLNIFEEAEFYRSQNVELFIKGMFFGIFVTMLLFNLFVFISIKDRAYLYFILFIFGFIIYFFCAEGLAGTIIFKGIGKFNYYMLLTISSFEQIFNSLFVRNFLNTKEKHTIIDKILITIIVIYSIILLTHTFGGYYFFNVVYVFHNFIMQFIPITWFIIGIIALKQGNRSARFYLLAVVLFLFFSFLYVSYRNSIFPETPVSRYFLYIGVAAQGVLLSFALSDKINIFRKEKEQAQKLAIENLHKTNRIKDEFLANTSHEIKTPLNGIIGLSDSITNRLSNDKPQDIKKDLNLITATGRRLYYLINDILDYTKLKNADIKLNKKAVDIIQLTNAVITLLKPTIKDKQIKIINRMSIEDTPLISADENRLLQILNNIIGNAIKYTNEGFITISSNNKNSLFGKNMLELTISDTGRGIPEDKLDKVFDSFETLDDVNENTLGTGLGLSITKQLVELHGGKIYATRNENNGTDFIFTIPVYNEKDSNVATQDELPEKDGAIVDVSFMNKELPEVERKTSYITDKLNVLIADDDYANIQILDNIVSSYGYNVMTAFDGTQVIDFIEEEKIPDLVILDLVMPNMSGYDVLKNIREDFSIFQLPVIILSSKTDTADITTGLGLGANDYLPKPYSKEELITRINNMLVLKESVDEICRLNNNLENIVQEKTIELRNTNTQLKKFSYRVSHDIKNPLSTIMNLLGLLKKKDGSVDSKTAELIKMIMKNARRIKEIIEDLLNLSTVKNKSYLQTSKINLSDMVRDICEDLKKLYSDLNTKIIIKDSVYTSGDAGLLKIAIENMLSNAFKYSQKNDEVIIEFGTEKRNEDTIYYIKDNGTGFDMKYYDKLFEHFERLHESDDYIGSGIGLSTVKEIIKIHNGDIWAESTLGKGSIFYFII